MRICCSPPLSLFPRARDWPVWFAQRARVAGLSSAGRPILSPPCVLFVLSVGMRLVFVAAVSVSTRIAQHRNIGTSVALYSGWKRVRCYLQQPCPLDGHTTKRRPHKEEHKRNGGAARTQAA
jgi:hypothetical protein